MMLMLEPSLMFEDHSDEELFSDVQIVVGSDRVSEFDSHTEV